MEEEGNPKGYRCGVCGKNFPFSPKGAREVMTCAYAHERLKGDPTEGVPPGRC